MLPIRYLCTLGVVVCLAQMTVAQTLIEVAANTSQQDYFAAQLTIRQQLSSRFRVGLSAQYGLPKYRFIAAKPIREGYATTLAIPITWELHRQEGIQLFSTFKAGIRWQGIIDPDENDQRDSILNSTALVGEVGLLVNVPLSKRFALQSGVTFPIAYELAPTVLFENMTTYLHLGGTAQLGRYALFVRGSMGSAFGASGDSQKFLWGLQAGCSVNLTPDRTPTIQVIETSF